MGVVILTNSSVCGQGVLLITYAEYFEISGWEAAQTSIMLIIRQKGQEQKGQSASRLLQGPAGMWDPASSLAYYHLFRLLLLLGTIKYKEEGDRYHLSCVHPAE